MNEATHTYAAYSFSHYCAEAANEKRKQYFKENFGEIDQTVSNGCLGECQGTGWIPIYKDEMTPAERTLWVQAEMDSPSEDGWHMVPCPTCKPIDALDEHIVKKGSDFELKSKKSGKNLGTYTSKKGAEKREREVEYFKHLKEGTDDPDSPDNEDDDKDTGDDDSPKSPEDRKEASKKKREDKAKKREQEKLLPYEFDNQKDAVNAGSHLGTQGTHLASGAGSIYRPGGSEQALRNAVATKKAKQKLKAGKPVHEDAIGFADMPNVIRRLKESVRKS